MGKQFQVVLPDELAAGLAAAVSDGEYTTQAEAISMQSRIGSDAVRRTLFPSSVCVRSCRRALTAALPSTCPEYSNSCAKGMATRLDAQAHDFAFGLR